ncbi:hypothetical protein QBC34DRAFT_374852 [Podospora aff. communis PSN243]|uniref:Hydrophobin n=1 Tax=Podospora aff. communis PSN243 TaxID=3040156 RepID=A0AAV9H588_9PEZI|nr:hypothetical protein QBC34DRAFT_374852 [Podospora aff. communis PSN243]
MQLTNAIFTFLAIAMTAAAAPAPAEPAVLEARTGTVTECNQPDQTLCCFGIGLLNIAALCNVIQVASSCSGTKVCCDPTATNNNQNGVQFINLNIATCPLVIL